MKRILVAVTLAVLAAPAFAVEVSAPYEQSQVDRQLPNLTAQRSSSNQGNVWADDHNFVAPAQ